MVNAINGMYVEYYALMAFLRSVASVVSLSLILLSHNGYESMG